MLVKELVAHLLEGNQEAEVIGLVSDDYGFRTFALTTYPFCFASCDGHVGNFDEAKDKKKSTAPLLVIELERAVPAGW